MPEKQQLNFRFPSELLEKIKEDAEKQGISHTQWIINACRKAMGEDASNISSDSGSNSETVKQLESRIEQIEKKCLDRDQIIELIRQVEDEEHEPTDNEVETGLNQTQLAQRLGTSRGSIYKYQKEDQKWQNFCQEKDPDGLIWHKHSNGMYYPDDQPVNLIKGVKEMALHLGLKEDELTQDVKEKNVNDLIKFENQTWRIIKKDKDGYWFEKVDKS